LKTLVVLPNWVGDTVLALPVLEALAASDRQLSVLSRPHLTSLLQPLPAVATVVSRNASDGDTVLQLREAAYEEALVLPNSFRSGWLPFRAGIPRRWGYSRLSLEGILRAFILRPAIRQHRYRGHHQVEDYGDLLAAMGVDPPTDWMPRLHLSPGQLDQGRQLLERARLASGKTPLIGLFPGAEFGPSKRWPWRRFAGFSRALRKQLPTSRQVVVAGPKEVWLAVRVHEESGKNHPVVGPDLDLGQLATVLAQLDLLVTNDSGPMHLAAAVGTPCLALFGPTNPVRTRPVGETHRVLHSDRWCSPCFRRRCPLLHHGCMKDIGVDEAVERALEMLDS
jgi:heptosyltransferase-2